MRNRTNNLLESFFEKLKDCVDGSKSMEMCIKALVSADWRAINEYRHRKLLIGHYATQDHDEELANLLRSTTHNVADQLVPQDSIGMEMASIFAYDGVDDDSSVVMVRGRQKSYRLQLTDWACGNLSRSERYQEAHRTTHLIANELADIEDGKELEDMMQFVDVQEIPATQKSLVVDELNPRVASPRMPSKRKLTQCTCGSFKKKMAGGVSTSCCGENKEDDDEDLEDDSCDASQNG
ncbi:hypothetical protein BBJ28_00001112 [Nothophytophthora sp. Chile5]|nr:hypothetical protein BBJ28_00001112 [Nothophytophthora sp. Chile5]